MMRRFAIMPSILILFFFLGCFLTPSKGFLWAFVPDDLGFVISGQEANRQTTPGGKTFTNSIGMTFVLIPAGSFMMGSPSSEPGRVSDETQHQVTLTKSFYMQTTEVTQGQWKAVMGTMTIKQGCLFPVQVQVPNNPSLYKNCGDDCPVENVSWNDCKEFIRKLNQKEGINKYRLPTEAEWEYACRAGTTGPYYATLDQAGWYSNNSSGTTHPVAKKVANGWGLYDMHGNVWEWCSDLYDRYPDGSVTDPEKLSNALYRVCRGCSWYDRSEPCRSASRLGYDPTSRIFILGFRLAANF